MVVSNRKFLFQGSIFWCYVSFREGKLILHITFPTQTRQSFAMPSGWGRPKRSAKEMTGGSLSYGGAPVEATRIDVGTRVMVIFHTLSIFQGSFIRHLQHHASTMYHMVENKNLTYQSSCLTTKAGSTIVPCGHEDLLPHVLWHWPEMQLKSCSWYHRSPILKWRNQGVSTAKKGA